MRDWCDQSGEQWATVDTQDWVGNFVIEGLTDSDDDPFIPLTRKPNAFQRLVMRVVMGWKWDDTLG